MTQPLTRWDGTRAHTSPRARFAAGYPLHIVPCGERLRNLAENSQDTRQRRTARMRAWRGMHTARRHREQRRVQELGKLADKPTEAWEYPTRPEMKHPLPHGPGPRTPQPATASSALEKRGFGRIPARSRVELRFGRKLGVTRQGQLLNLGRAGFRARHADGRIKADTLVAFRHQFAEGMARVKWTKPCGRSFESGFEIVEPAT